MKKFKKYKNRSHYNIANVVYYSVSSSPTFIDGVEMNYGTRVLVTGVGNYDINKAAFKKCLSKFYGSTK